MTKNKNIQNRHSYAHTHAFLETFERLFEAQGLVTSINPLSLNASLAHSVIGQVMPKLPSAMLSYTLYSNPLFFPVKSVLDRDFIYLEAPLY